MIFTRLDSFTTSRAGKYSDTPNTDIISTERCETVAGKRAVMGYESLSGTATLQLIFREIKIQLGGCLSL